jgi:hypothetical protein
VHRTLDGGSTFTDITGPLPDRYPADFAVDPADEATVYLAMSGFGTSHLFKSTDYGTTWIDIDGGRLPDVPTTAVAVDPLYPHHVYVGNDIGVFFTRDDGATWEQLAEGLSPAVLVHELGISDAARVLRAFTHGRGVFEHPLIGLPCAADINGNGDVDALDFLVVIVQWGTPCTNTCEADITGPDGVPDGNVDGLDYLLVIAQWGSPAECLLPR